jgi:hypothetical protein
MKLDLTRTYCKGIRSSDITLGQLKTIHGLLGDRVTIKLTRDWAFLTIGQQDMNPFEDMKVL